MNLMLLSLKYKELQILKHSLQYYITRTNSTVKDIEEEKRLLAKVTDEVEEMKGMYGIS